MIKVISFRVTDEDWFRIERAAADTGYKPNDLCRILALEKANEPVALTRGQRILFSQISRTLFLLETGLALLAEDTLESEHWKRVRTYARTNLDEITGRALAEIASNNPLLKN
jgi:hypothetical protein